MCALRTVSLSLCALLSACAAKQAPPLQRYTLGMGRAEYRSYGGAKALCEAEPRWLADELSSFNGVLSRFLSGTEQAAQPEAPEHAGHLALLEEGSRTLGPVLEVHAQNLRALPACGFHRSGAFPSIAQRGAELVKAAKARLEGAPGALAAAGQRKSQRQWEAEAPAREAQAKQTWCSANVTVGSGDLYFARQYPNGRTEWLFCDGLRVEQLPPGEPTLVTPEGINRRDRRRIQPLKYLEAAKAYPPEEIDRRPGAAPGAGTESATR
jgi:hypothetical protein